MYIRARLIKAVLLILALFLVTALSCDEVQRHKVLTFFFDGVPPLEAEIAGTESEPNAAAPGQPAAGPHIFRHKPQRECDLCHGKRQASAGFTSEVQLVTKPPELCYSCHPETDYSQSALIVHGPVAVGQCLFCHHHHESMYPYLLKKGTPELCLQCHEQEDIDSIPDHSGEKAAACLRCHAGHTSRERGLLKKGVAGQDPNEQRG